MTLTVEEIAHRLDGQVEGNSQAEISRLAGIREAVPGDLTFVATPHYAGAAATTRATAVIVNEDWNRPCSATLIRVKSADKAFADAAKWFAPPPISFTPGIHPTAIVAPDAKLGQDVCLTLLHHRTWRNHRRSLCALRPLLYWPRHGHRR